MDLPDFDLSVFLPYMLAVASQRVSRGLALRYAREFGLSIPEWRVLAHLTKDEALSVKDITARVDMDKSKVSRAATRLTGAGLLSKVADKGDGRLVALTLTDAGRALMARLIPLALGYEAEVLAALGPEVDAFARGLAVLGGEDEVR